MIEQYFVVEGESDKILLEKMLPPEFVSKTKFIVSEGYNTAISKARSILVSSEIPVYILVDAETTDPNRIDEKKDYINQMLSQVSVSNRFKILMSVPETEILLFYDKAIFETLFSVKMDDKQWEHAKYEPRKTLMELTEKFDPDHMDQILNHKLTADMAKKLRENEIIQHIISKN